MRGSAGGLVLLLLGIYLLLAFFSGRLEWLFNLGSQVSGSIKTTTAAPPFPGANPAPAGQSA